jgi:hypothetical protein
VSASQLAKTGYHLNGIQIVGKSSIPRNRDAKRLLLRIVIWISGVASLPHFTEPPVAPMPQNHSRRLDFCCVAKWNNLC